jgi:hypothetical protein
MVDHCAILEYVWLWDLLDKYQSFITTTIGTIAGFIVGIYIYKKTEQKENRCFHFKELRDRVITPIASWLNDDYVFIQSLEQTRKQAMTRLSTYLIPPEERKFQLDPFLLEDFLANHYPEFTILWDKLYKDQTVEMQKTREINAKIEEKLKTLVDFYGFNIKSGAQDHALSLAEFQNMLRTLIFQNKKPTLGIQEDINQPRRILFEGRIIYMLIQDQNLKAVLTNLTHIVDDVLDDSTLKKLIDEHRVLNEERSTMVL